MNKYYLTQEDYLQHHGILGQRWGKLNGPPYPLGSGDHSARERKEGYTKSKLGKRNDHLYDRNDKKYYEKEKNINKQIKKHDKKIDRKYKASKSDLNFVVNKKAIQNGIRYAKFKANEIISSNEFKIAMGVGIGLVALYAANRLSQRFILDYAIDYSDTSPNYLVNWNSRESGFSSLSDIPKASINYYDEYFKEGKIDNLLSHNNFYDDGELLEIVKSPSKLLDLSIKNPELYDSITNRTNNCMLCTNSLIMRLKGYDTMAQETMFGTGWKPKMITEWFEGAEVVSPHKITRNGLIKELSSQGAGSYGNFICFWKQGGGHSILYTVREDGVHFIDGQIGKEYSYSELFSRLNIENCRYARLDNCNIKEGILKSIEQISNNIEDTIKYL